MTLLSDALTKTQCELYALSMLRNHVHAIIVPPSAPALASCMHRWAHRYAVRRNRATGGSGKLFEERYRALPLGDDAALATCTLYVDFNLESAGASSRAQRWSTMPLHAGDAAASRIPSAIWSPSPWYRALGDCDGSRADAYRALAHEYRAMREAMAAEARPSRPDTRRLERPNRSSAR